MCAYLHRSLSEVEERDKDCVDNCVRSSSSFYNTKSVVLCLGITALVCLSVTIFSFQSKVRRTKIITSNCFQATMQTDVGMMKQTHHVVLLLPIAGGCHILSGRPVFSVHGHALLCHYHLHRRPLWICKFTSFACSHTIHSALLEEV